MSNSRSRLRNAEAIIDLQVLLVGKLVSAVSEPAWHELGTSFAHPTFGLLPTA